jgi:hypothetical protein
MVNQLHWLRLYVHQIAYKNDAGSHQMRCTCGFGTAWSSIKSDAAKEFDAHIEGERIESPHEDSQPPRPTRVECGICAASLRVDDITKHRQWHERLEEWQASVNHDFKLLQQTVGKPGSMVEKPQREIEICAECGACLTIGQDSERHYDWHTKLKKPETITCGICGKSITPDDITKHYALHSKANPYERR